MAAKRVKVQRQKAVGRIAVTKAPAVLGADQYEPAVNAAAVTKFSAAQSQLAAAQRAQQAQGGQIDAWFQNYRNAVAQAGAANQAASQQAQGNLTALGNAAAANDRAGQAQVTAQMQADAASRGATVDPALAAQMQMGSAVRGGNLASSQALQSAQGFNQGTVDRQRGVAGEGSKVAALLENAGKVKALQGQGVDLASQIGAFKTQYKDQLKAEEAKANADAQTARLANFVATGKMETPNEYGFSATEWNKKTPEERQRIMLDYKKQSTTATAPPKSATPNAYGYTPKEWNAMTSAKRQQIMIDFKHKSSEATAKPPKPNAPDAHGNTPKQIRAANDSFKAARIQASRYKVGFKTWHELADFLVSAKNVNPTLATAAAQLALNNGRVGSNTQASLEKRGIVIPKPKVKKKAAPKPATSGIDALLPPGPLHDALAGG